MTNEHRGFLGQKIRAIGELSVTIEAGTSFALRGRIRRNTNRSIFDFCDQMSRVIKHDEAARRVS